jgi:hypothetical protein
MEITITYDMIEERAKAIEAAGKENGEEAPQETVDFLENVENMLFELGFGDSDLYEAVLVLRGCYEVGDVGDDD